MGIAVPRPRAELEAPSIPLMIRVEAQARGLSLTGAIVTDAGVTFYRAANGQMIGFSRRTRRYVVRRSPYLPYAVAGDAE